MKRAALPAALLLMSSLLHAEVRVQIVFPEGSVPAGHACDVPVYIHTDGERIASYAVELQYPVDMLEFVGIEGGTLELYDTQVLVRDAPPAEPATRRILRFSAITQLGTPAKAALDASMAARIRFRARVDIDAGDSLDAQARLIGPLVNAADFTPLTARVELSGRPIRALIFRSGFERAAED